MKKRNTYIFLFYFVAIQLYAQIDKYIPIRETGFIPNYDSFMNNFSSNSIIYEAIEDIPILNDYGRFVFDKQTVKAHSVLTNQKIIQAANGIIVIGNDSKWFSTDGIKIKNSDVFPDSFVYKNNENNKIWIPSWYKEILNNTEYKNIINDNIPKSINYYTIFDDFWIDDYGTSLPCKLICTNQYISFWLFGSTFSADFLIKNIKKEKKQYIIQCIPNLNYSLYKNENINLIMKNFPNVNNKGFVTFKFVFDDFSVKIYNYDTNILIENYICVTEDYYNSLHTFIMTGKNINTNAILYKNNITQNKIMIVNENLKLRSGEATSTQVLTVMSADTKVKILELGKSETIDGISSNWVKVEIISGNDRDGNKLKSGMTGWCYGGYLE